MLHCSLACQILPDSPLDFPCFEKRVCMTNCHDSVTDTFLILRLYFLIGKRLILPKSSKQFKLFNAGCMVTIKIIFVKNVGLAKLQNQMESIPTVLPLYFQQCCKMTCGKPELCRYSVFPTKIFFCWL